MDAINRFRHIFPIVNVRCFWVKYLRNNAKLLKR